jgi:hypothetical protein
LASGDQVTDPVLAWVQANLAFVVLTELTIATTAILTYRLTRRILRKLNPLLKMLDNISPEDVEAGALFLKTWLADKRQKLAEAKKEYGFV